MYTNPTTIIFVMLIEYFILMRGKIEILNRQFVFWSIYFFFVLALFN